MIVRELVFPSWYAAAPKARSTYSLHIFSMSDPFFPTGTSKRHLGRHWPQVKFSDFPPMPLLFALCTKQSLSVICLPTFCFLFGIIALVLFQLTDYSIESGEFSSKFWTQCGYCKYKIPITSKLCSEYAWVLLLTWSIVLIPKLLPYYDLSLSPVLPDKQQQGIGLAHDKAESVSFSFQKFCKSQLAAGYFFKEAPSFEAREAHRC